MAEDALGALLAVDGDAERRRPQVRRRRFDDVVLLADTLESRIRQPRVDSNQRIRIPGSRERRQNTGVDPREEVDADGHAESQRHNADGRDAGMGAQHAEPVVEILPEHLQPPAEPDVPHLFLDALCAPQLNERPPARRWRRQPPPLPLLGTRLDVEGQLVGQIALEPRAPDERSEPEA